MGATESPVDSHVRASSHQTASPTFLKALGAAPQHVVSYTKEPSKGSQQHHQTSPTPVPSPQEGRSAEQRQNQKQQQEQGQAKPKKHLLSRPGLNSDGRVVAQRQISPTPPPSLTEEAQAANDRLARAMAGTGDPSGLIDTLVGAQDIDPEGFRAEYADLLDRYRQSLPENRQGEYRLFRARADEALRGEAEAIGGEDNTPEPATEWPLPSERFDTGIDPYPRYNTLDAPTEAMAARGRTRDRNYEVAVQYFEELQQESGIEAHREKDGQITLDFGDGAILENLEPGEAGRMAALMLDSPEDLEALRSFAAGEVDLDSVATRLAALYRKAEDLEVDYTQELPTSAEGGLSAEELAEIYRLETLYLAEEARRNGRSHDEVMWLLDSGFAPDPLAAEKAVTGFVLSILPGTGEAMALRDAGVDLLALQEAARNGDWSEAAKSGGLLALSTLGMIPIPGLNKIRPAARLLDRSAGGGATRMGLRDWILDQGTRHRSRLELARMESSYRRGVGEAFPIQSVIDDEIWAGLPREMRRGLERDFAGVRGRLGEDLARGLLARAGFGLRTEKGQRSYRVRMEDGSLRMRYHDAVAQNEAMNFFGLYIRPVESKDGSTVNFEIKTDGAVKNPKQTEADRRVLESDNREDIDAHRPQNPPVNSVLNFRVLSTQLPEGQLVNAVKERLRSRYPDDIVDEVVTALAAYDLASRRKGSGVRAVPIGVLLATVLASLTEEETDD